MKRRSFLRLFIAFLTVISFQLRGFATGPANPQPQRAKYVFLFIGDGMGLAQVNLAQAYKAALGDQIGFVPLNFTQFPQAGLVTTYAKDRLITGSAAAGTALATGMKTDINRISMSPDGKDNYESIASKAKKQGMKVGIVTSVSIDHATPAVFYAHQPDRNMYFEIGTDLARSNFDYFAGGGFLKPNGMWKGKQISLPSLAQQNGYILINEKENFERLPPNLGKVLVISPRLAAEAAIPFALDMSPEDITLADFTTKGIQLLTNDNGFFMMVEGGKIDWACHANDAAAEIQEVIAFDDAVQAALDFYAKHPEETLIVVTADHETGGLAMGNNTLGYNSNIGILQYQKSSVEGLNKIVADFRAKKTGNSEADFARILKVLETDMGLNSEKKNTLLSDDEKANLKRIFDETVYAESLEEGAYEAKEPFTEAALKILAEKAGISWGSRDHTCIEVPVYAIGTGAELFSGTIDNTGIEKTMEMLMGL